MSREPRRARLRALAKINLSLRVLGKRPDGYHELRTVFQTISLGDRLDISYTPSRDTTVTVESSIEIPDNLVERTACRLMEETRATGHVTLRLLKRIPLGSGMGGGSSDAAAVLLALPVLMGREIPLARLTSLAEQLGADVPFFLLGGTALGLGRGSEVHPLPDAPPWRGLAVFPGFPVSTAEAYRALGRELTTPSESNTMSEFQPLSWTLGRGLDIGSWVALGENDFEPFAETRYPQLAVIRRKLRATGASGVMMSGSGSSLFAIYPDRTSLRKAASRLGDTRSETFSLVNRARYRRLWWRSLAGHLEGETWPPRGRYSR